LAIGSGVLAAVVLAVMFALYLRYVRYERVASLHLPESTVLAVRVDVEQAIFYEPIRRHILPLFGGPGGSPTEADARLSRIEVRSRLRRGDLREIVIGRGATRRDWVIVLGGIFPRGSDSDRLVTALSDEPGWTSADEGRRAEHRATGIAVSRAKDGAVVIGSSPALLVAALTPSATFETLGLEPRGAGGFALSPAALSELATWPAVLVAGELSGDLARLDSVTGTFTPGDRVRLVTVFRAKEGQAAKQAAAGLLELMRAHSRSDVGSRENELYRGVVDRAAIRDLALGVELSCELERPEVDYGLAALADAVRARW
jgi:hypothetical protein